MEKTQEELDREYEWDADAFPQDSFEVFVEHQEYFASENLDKIIKRNREIANEHIKHN